MIYISCLFSVTWCWSDGCWWWYGFAIYSIKMMFNLFTFIVLYGNGGGEGASGGGWCGPVRSLTVNNGQQSPLNELISIVRREGVILGNEGARICWPFAMTEKLYSESYGQSLCSSPLRRKKTKDWAPRLEGMSAILKT